MLAQLREWGEEVSLVPNSGIQFLDFGFDFESLRSIKRSFIERPGTPSDDGTVFWQLLRVPDMPNNEEPPEEFRLRQSDLELEVTTTMALEVFLNKWVPLPFLRVKAGVDAPELLQFDQGPTNWARVRIVKVPDLMRGDGPSHRAVFAFDTTIEQQRPNRPYVAPGKEDVISPTLFRLASRLPDIAWFFADTRSIDERASGPWFQGWVDDWLRDYFDEFKSRKKPKDGDIVHPLEHWIRYIALLETLQQALHPPRIRLVDTISLAGGQLRRKTPAVSVDLILDIGNSRTCGLLVESYPDGEQVDLNNTLVLQLRDLGQPELVYAEPFSSHVEIAQPRFGRHDLARRSSRNAAFLWPSMLRVGPEAQRLRADNDGTGPSTGMSSPKRYLWDTERLQGVWEFQPVDYGPEKRPPPIEVQTRQKLTARGTVIRHLLARGGNPGREPAVPASELSFSRSSFFMLMLAEVVVQAIAMANSPGVRHGRHLRDSPRQINRIVLTVPPATTLQERQIMSRHARGAVDLVWDLFGWDTGDAPPEDSELARSWFQKPKIRADLDEASCTQFVWLYGEIARKFSGAAEEFARIVGRDRPLSDPEREPAPGAPVGPSIRIASIDVGGGTTDLMVTTYHIERNRELLPTQNFREGFRIAGDDISRALIEQMVFPAIAEAMVLAGAKGAEQILQRKFGGDYPDMPVQQKQLRRQFTLRILHPIAVAILAEHEARPAFSDAEVEFRTIGKLMGEAAARRIETGERALPESLVDYLEADLRHSAPGFRLEDVEIPLDFRLLRVIVENMMGVLADNLCEAIAEFDVDMVLISGRPARLPAVTDLFVNRAPVAPHRILSLADYPTDTWYPFRSADNRRISDPKTCTAVGGMLCILAERQIENFTLMTHRLSMRSTARFIGPMEKSGEVKTATLLFEDIDLDSKAPVKTENTLLWSSRMRIGFRQLPLERWISTPLYRLDFIPGAEFSTNMLPFTVTISRPEVELEPDLTSEQIMAIEAEREIFRVGEAEDARGDSPRRDARFVLSLCTLQSDEGYWLDTGAFNL